MPYRKIKAPEWQDFRLQRNVAEISKILASAREFSYFSALEAILLLASFLWDKLFPYHTTVKSILLWLALVGIALCCIWIIWKLCRISCSWLSLSAGRVTRKDCIDLFDNDVCYFVMMADSYSELVDSTSSKPLKRFYLIESKFYLNKSVDELYKTIHLMRNVYRSPDTNELLGNKEVSRLRLYNIIECIIEIQKRNTIHESTLCNCFSEEQENVDKHYQKIFREFINKAAEELRGPFIRLQTKFSTG